MNDTAQNANAFASTFYFFADTQCNAKKIKRACKPTQGDRAIVQCKLDTTHLRTDRRATDNSTFAIGGVSCSADSLEVAESFVLRIKFSGKNPAHRKSAKRYMKPADWKIKL